MENVYESIAARTGGNIYIGVVGPVRTGKSTFIKRFMEQMVIPNIEDPYRRERARDELPQSGSGRTIMTSEPKFVPEEAVEIMPDGKTALRVRLIDSVGYMVDGAAGAEEDGSPRMVTTPWCDVEIPMTEAAEIGTKKVMEEHCSIGMVITTDGSITEIPRRDYETAERRAILDMQATGKPYLVIINSRNPASEEAEKLKDSLRREYGVEAVLCDCQSMDTEKITALLRAALFAFPVREIRVHLPRWLDALEEEHPIREQLCSALLAQAEPTENLASVEKNFEGLREQEQVQDFYIRSVQPGQGTVECVVTMPEALYYETLSGKTGMEIQNDAQLMTLLTKLSQVKGEYDRISDALSAVQATGYGVVMPAAQQLQLEKPELVKKGGTCGVKLKAYAPAIHMMRVDIGTQINPMVGDENQAKDLMDYLAGADPEKLSQSHIFGKSVYDMLQEGISAKVLRLPQEVREKFRGTLSRIVNDGANGLVCLIL